MKKSFYPAESLSFYRIPLALFALLLAVAAAFLVTAATGAAADEWGTFAFLAAVYGAAVLFFAGCLWMMAHRGVILEEHCFRSGNWKRRAHGYDEIGSVLLLPKTISTGRSRDISVKRNGEPVEMLFLMKRQDADHADRWRRNLAAGSQTFLVNFGEDCIGKALYAEELLRALLQKNPDIEVISSVESECVAWRK